MDPARVVAEIEKVIRADGELTTGVLRLVTLAKIEEILVDFGNERYLEGKNGTS